MDPRLLIFVLAIILNDMLWSMGLISEFIGKVELENNVASLLVFAIFILEFLVLAEEALLEESAFVQVKLFI